MKNVIICKVNIQWSHIYLYLDAYKKFIIIIKFIIIKFKWFFIIILKFNYNFKIIILNLNYNLITLKILNIKKLQLNCLI